MLPALLCIEHLTHLDALYSMHDNRWEGEKEEDKEKEDNPKTEKTKKKEEDVEKSRPAKAKKVGGFIWISNVSNLLTNVQ